MNEDVLLDQNENSLILSSYDSEPLGLQINVETDEVSSEHNRMNDNKDDDVFGYGQTGPDDSSIHSNSLETVECSSHPLTGEVDLNPEDESAYGSVDEGVPLLPEDGQCTTIITISEMEELQDDPVRTQWVTTKKNKSRLQKSGHTWKKGTWRENEIKQLKENIARYCNDRGIKDPQDVIFHMGKEERKDFYPTVSAGLNRPLFAVYRRVRRMYDKQNHRGKYTDDEITYLKQLVAKYGKNWTVIGQHMGRSSDSVRDRCRLFVKEDTNNLGKWTEEEEEKLAEAVRKVTGKDLESDITNGITWSSVAKMVQGRTEKQCRSKWLNYLNWKLNKGEKWTKSDDQMLVERLMNCDASSADEINWQTISHGWRSVRSPQWLRFKFWTLKRLLTSTYPSKNIGSFKELLLNLHVLVCSKVYNSWSRNWMDKKTCQQNDSDATEFTSISKATDSDREKWLNDCFLNSCSKSSSPAMNETPPCDDSESSSRLKISEQMLDVSSSDPMLISQDESESVEQENRLNSQLNEDDNSQVTVQFSTSASQGIFLRQNPDGRTSDCQLMICDYNNQYNIHLTPEVLSLLNNSAKPIQVGVVPQHFQFPVAEPSDTDIGMQSTNILDYTVSKGNTSPVLSSVMQDVVVGNSSDDERSSTHLHGEFLLDGSELAASDGDGR